MPNPITTRRLRLAAQADAGAAAGSGPDPHAVKDLRAYPLREPASGRSYTVIRIETESGLAGYGECAGATEKELARARQIVTGRPATAYEVVRGRLAPLPGLEAAVNMALLDITGKAAKAPVYQVLGGPTRNKARALTALEGKSGDALRASLESGRKAGYRAFLVPAPPPGAMNQGKAYVEKVRRLLEGLRSIAGEETDFVLDGGGLLSPGDAASVSAELERFHLLWFDEPCGLTGLGAVRKLAEENVTPLGFGRGLHEGSRFLDLLREETVDVLRPSLGLNGISQIRRIAALAETYYIALAPYHDGGPIATAAALQLAASLPNFYIQQIPLPAAEEDQRMRAELLSGWSEPVKEGFAGLPVGPGLGIKVDERALQKYKERAA